MGGLAILARQMGHEVSGSDQHVYPPMSTQLEQQGILLKNGYHPTNIDPRPDLVIIGNALSRGNPEVEEVLNLGLPYTSGARWLFEYLLKDRTVLAVAGTHGKTTTTSMLAWIFEYAAQSPGFLVGGIPRNFDVSARLGKAPYFIIEADEYDTAFFDKRSKFLHYHPRIAILNNLEYDHADIFPDLMAIQRQFHHLVRIVPGNGMLITPANDPALQEVLRMGCWTPVEQFGLTGDDDAVWQAESLKADGSLFRILRHGAIQGEIAWSLTGQHNICNALAAIAAAAQVGIEPNRAIQALCRFQGVKRRMEMRACIDGITLYDDFAHHPTAIRMTLEGLRARVNDARLIAVLEPRSNTMKLGVHKNTLLESLNAADQIICYQPPELGWQLQELAGKDKRIRICDSLEQIIQELSAMARHDDHIVFMSNGGFGGIHQKVEDALRARVLAHH